MRNSEQKERQRVNSCIAGHVTSMPSHALFLVSNVLSTNLVKGNSMYKNIALLALLLPFSGYAISKEKHKKQLEARLEKLMCEMMEYNMILCSTLPIMMFAMTQEQADKIVKELKEKSQELEALNKEYQEL